LFNLPSANAAENPFCANPARNRKAENTAKLGENAVPKNAMMSRADDTRKANLRPNLLIGKIK